MQLAFISQISFLNAQLLTETVEESIFQSSQNLHQWGAINSFHGLPSERVNAIAQSANGFLWFGTDNGIAKFDGRRVQTNITSSLSSTRILDLKTDDSGVLWIATENGAFYYDDESFAEIKELRGYSINAIFIDEEAKSVLLTDAIGTVFNVKKNPNGTLIVEVIVKKSLPLTSIVKYDGKLMLGTFNSGIQRLENDDLKPILTHPRPYFVNILSTSPAGNLWIGARSSAGNTGLFIGEKLPELKSVGENLGTVNSVSFDHSGGSWVGTEDRGAYLFEGQQFRKRFTFENTSGGLRSNKILATFVDREGVVWFGTDKGISRFDSKSAQNEILSENVESNFVRTLFESKDGKLYAGSNRGLFAFDHATGSWISVNGFENDSIYALSGLGGGNVLAGTRDGYFIVRENENAGQGREKLSDETARAITQFKGEIYFAAFQSGLKTIEGDVEKLVFASNVIAVHNENDKFLWMGTIKKGVHIFDGKRTFSEPQLDPLKEIVVRSIAGDQQIGIWLATEKGLYLFKDEKLDLIISGSEARSVIADIDGQKQPRVWCATDRGLYHLTFDSNFGWITSRLDIEEGLSSQNLFAISRRQDGSFIIGTNRGIVRYQPTSIRPLLVANRIVSQRVHQLRELKSGINLDYPQNSLSIDVAGISSRTFPEQFQYSFLLFDSNNKIIDKRFGSDSQFLMENLKADNYHVEVRAFDGNLVASEPLEFDLIVEDAPFPWIATILGILLIIALAALIWATISQRKIFRTSKQLAHANEELNATRLDLANEAERERRRISRDLHDQTLADLRHLLLMADEISTDEASAFRSEIEGVSDEIRRICEDLSPSVLENIGFAAALEWALGNAVQQVAHEEKMHHDFICDENLDEKLRLNRAEQIQVYRIVQEILSNVVRHSKASNIKMSVKNSDVFLLMIEEDGIPFDPENVKKGRGLSNIDARAKLIKAKVIWERGYKKGMIFSLQV